MEVLEKPTDTGEAYPGQNDDLLRINALARLSARRLLDGDQSGAWDAAVAMHRADRDRTRRTCAAVQETLETMMKESVPA